MKRYLAFYGDQYYPCGGMFDFLLDFNTEAIGAIQEKLKDEEFLVWAHVYDIEQRKVVWEKQQ